MPYAVVGPSVKVAPVPRAALTRCELHPTEHDGIDQCGVVPAERIGAFDGDRVHTGRDGEGVCVHAVIRSIRRGRGANRRAVNEHLQRLSTMIVVFALRCHEA